MNGQFRSISVESTETLKPVINVAKFKTMNIKDTGSVKSLSLHSHLKIPSLRLSALQSSDRNGKLCSRSRSDSFSPPPGVYLNDGHRTVDFTLVYEGGQPEELARQRRYFEKNLQREGLILELDPMEGDESNGKLCFVKVHATWETLCRGAEMLQMKMPLKNTNPPDVKLISDQCGPFCSSWFRLSREEETLIGSTVPQITAQFTCARVDQFLVTDRETFFSSTQRIRIVYDIMQRARCDPNNSKKRGLQWLLTHNIILAAYPPHDGGTETRHLDINDKHQWSNRQILRQTWANFNKMFKAQPLHLVREYFGEKVGFYFAWLGFYTEMLIFPSFIGLISFIYGMLKILLSQ